MKSAEGEARPLPALGRNLTFGLFDALGRAIVAGQYCQASLPTEMELARHYRVSHGVIREALKMLAAKGLISAHPRRGTVAEPEEAWNLLDADILRWLMARGISRDLALKFKDVRAAIEPEAAALAARAARPDDHARIEAGMRRVAAARRGRDNAVEADVAFHLAILTAAHNPFYSQFQGLLGTALRAVAPVPGRLKATASHAAVSEAIRSGDPDRARRHMRDIIDTALADSRHAVAPRRES